MKILEYFDKVYCINLDERTDRWEQVKVEFDKLGILDSVERWPAIKNSDGNLGCTLSHKTLIEHCRKEGFENVLIFEDDVLFVETDTDRLTEAFNELKELGNWDLFYIGSTVDPNVGKFVRVTDRILKTNFAYTTHAYAVNAQAFTPMIDSWDKSISNGHNIVDVVVNTQIVRRGKSFVMDPIYAIQQPGLSDIGNSVVDGYEWMVTFFNNIKKSSGV